MRRFMILIAFLLGVAATAPAQIGKSVSVSAGTPEDKALTEIYGAPDGPEKVALLDKFMADFGKGDMELLADQLYVQTYLGAEKLCQGLRVRVEGSCARSEQSFRGSEHGSRGGRTRRREKAIRRRRQGCGDYRAIQKFAGTGGDFRRSNGRNRRPRI